MELDSTEIVGEGWIVNQKIAQFGEMVSGTSGPFNAREAAEQAAIGFISQGGFAQIVEQKET